MSIGLQYVRNYKEEKWQIVAEEKWRKRWNDLAVYYTYVLSVTFDIYIKERENTWCMSTPAEAISTNSKNTFMQKQSIFVYLAEVLN